MKRSTFSTGLFEHHISPRLEDVKIYFLQKGLPEAEAVDFFSFYEGRHWKDKGGNLINNWKSIAYRWIQSVLRKTPSLYQKANRQ